MRVKSPIEQHMLGHAGLYRQQNIEKRKVMSVREWAELCAKDEWRAPGVDEVALKAAGDKLPPRKKRGKKAERLAKDEPVDTEIHDISIVKEEDAESTFELVGVDDTATHHEAIPPEDLDHMHTLEEVPDHEDEEHRSPTPANDAESMTPECTSGRKKRVFQTRAARDAALALRAELDKEYLKAFDPHSAWLPPDTKAANYTPEFCSTLERRYWRNCGLGKPPWYGADTAGMDGVFCQCASLTLPIQEPYSLTRRRPGMSHTFPQPFPVCYHHRRMDCLESILRTYTLACGGPHSRGMSKTWICFRSTTFTSAPRSIGMQYLKVGQSNLKTRCEVSVAPMPFLQ